MYHYCSHMKTENTTKFTLLSKSGYCDLVCFHILSLRFLFFFSFGLFKILVSSRTGDISVLELVLKKDLEPRENTNRKDCGCSYSLDLVKTV